MLRANPDPKERRPPVALCHGFALQKWSVPRQNFLEGGPRTSPGIASLKLVNRFETSWYLQRLQYVREIVTRKFIFFIRTKSIDWNLVFTWQ